MILQDTGTERTQAPEALPVRLWRLAGLIGALTVVCVGLQALARFFSWPLDLTANKGAGQVLLYLIVLGMVFLFTRLWWPDAREPSLRQYLRHRQRAVAGFGLAAAVTLAGQGALYGLLGGLGAAHWSPTAWRHLNGALASQTVVALVIVIVLATTEETIFRGFVFNYLRPDARRSTTATALMVSAVVFTLAHNFHTPQNWLQPQSGASFAGLALLGVLLAVTYLATRSLACGIGVHTALVWLDVFRKRTDLITIDQSFWWMGTNNDLRTAPIVWALFLCLAAGFWLLRRRLRPLTQIEGLAEASATPASLPPPVCAALPSEQARR